MGLEAFTPQVWAGSILENFNDAHVYVDGANRDYEGDISDFGDSVKINSHGRVTISAYTKNTNISAAETLDDAQQVLVIDEANYFNFQIDDIDKAQNKPTVMASATRDAGWGLADALDVDVATELQNNVSGVGTGAGTGNWLANRAIGLDPGESDAYELLVDLGVKLTENNVPLSGRWVVVPPWFHGMLLKDPRFVSFGTGPNREALLNGRVGRAAGLDIRESNNVPLATATYTILAGHPSGLTVAEQIPPSHMTAYQPELRFGDALKGLHLYGIKVTRPYAIARCDVTNAG